MDRRLLVRLVDDQHGAALHQIANPVIQLRHRDRRREARLALVAQNAESGAGLHQHTALSSRAVDQVVSAIPEEDESSISQPAKEVLDLVDFLASITERPTVFRELRHHRVRGVDHGVEVVRRAHDVLETAAQLPLDIVEPCRIFDSIHFAVYERLLRRAVSRRPHRDQVSLLVAINIEEGVHDLGD